MWDTECIFIYFLMKKNVCIDDFSHVSIISIVRINLFLERVMVHTLVGGGSEGERVKNLRQTLH